MSNRSPVRWLSDAKYAFSKTCEKAIAWADSKVGVKEIGRNSGPDVEEFLKSVNLTKGFAWCGAFVYWCYKQAGADLSKLPAARQAAGVINWYNWAKRTNRIISNPKRGDLGLWLNQRRSDGTQPGHIFFVISPPVLNWVVLRTIEGNTDGEEGSREGDGVYKRTRSRLELARKHKFVFINMQDI